MSLHFGRYKDVTTLSPSQFPNTLLVYLRVDTLFGQPFKGKLYGFYLARIQAGLVSNLPLQLKGLYDSDASVRIWISEKSLYNSPINCDLTNCFLKAVKVVADVADIFSPFEKTALLDAINCVSGMTSDLLDVQQSLSLKPKSKAATVGDYLKTMAFGAYKCASSAGILAFELTPLGKAFKFLVKANDLYQDIKTIKSECYTNACSQTGNEEAGLSGYGQNWLLPGPDNGISKNVRSVGSLDPNDKLGPDGVKDQHFVSGLDPLAYMIRFENKSVATGDAQIVKVVDTLDRKRFALNTFELNKITIGSRTINLHPGQRKVSQRIDLRPDRDVLLDIKVTLNDSTGVVTADFFSLDPITQLPGDLIGFLPPNKVSPQGEGSISYTIRTHSALPDQTVVTNQASITFDEKEIIKTPVWLNTLDVNAPESNVQALPPVSPTTSFPIRWTGSDSGSGIRSYDIYYSMNGGAKRLWLSRTSSASAVFTGKADSTYSFYSVASDYVLRRETPPGTFDASTTIRIITATNPIMDESIKVFPNPAASIIITEIPEIHQVTAIQLMNMNGSIISERFSQFNKKYWQVEVTGVERGMYLLKVVTTKSIFTQKILVE